MQSSSRCGGPLVCACPDVANSHATSGQASHCQLPPGNSLHQGSLPTGMCVSTPTEVTYRRVGQITEMEIEGEQVDGDEGATSKDFRSSPGSQMSEICLRAAPNCRRLR